MSDDKQGSLEGMRIDEEEKELEKNELNPLNDQQSLNKGLLEEPLSYATTTLSRELLLFQRFIDRYRRNKCRDSYFSSGDSDEEEVMLLFREVSKDITNQRGQTLYHAAVDAAAFSLIEKLVSAGVDINMHDSTGKTPLIYAIKKKSFAYQDLIKAGADVNQVDPYGRSALFYVANITQASWIIGAGARMDETDGDGDTALHYQLIQGYPSAAEETINRFTSCFSLSNAIGNNVLHIMATMGYLTLATKLQRIVKRKIRFKELAAATNIRGKTLLAATIETNKVSLITKLLYYAYPELDIQNDNYETPVMVSVEKTDKAWCKFT